MMRRAVRHLLSVIIPSVDDPVQTEEVLMLLHGARGVLLRRGDNLSEMILITFWRCAHIKVGGSICSRPTGLAIEIHDWDECVARRQGLSN